jgi:hypothetical protein
VLQHLRQRVVEALAGAGSVTLSTYGPADIQAGVFDCAAVDLTLYLLVPRTSDHLFNLEHNPQVVVTTEAWQLRGMASIAADREADLPLLQRPDVAWYEVVAVQPTRLQIAQTGGGHAETIDID